MKNLKDMFEFLFITGVAFISMLIVGTFAVIVRVLPYAILIGLIYLAIVGLV